jgi:phosphoglycolate phosphatase-like HAD superfamily hydrolase
LLGKDVSITALLKKEKIQKRDVIYVGDETRDVLAMKKVDIPVIAVGWGLTPPEKLSSLPPDLNHLPIVDSLVLTESCTFHATAGGRIRPGY